MIIYILYGTVVLAIAFAWACCVAAKRADEKIEKMMEAKGVEEK